MSRETASCFNFIGKPSEGGFLSTCNIHVYGLTNQAGDRKTGYDLEYHATLIAAFRPAENPHDEPESPIPSGKWFVGSDMPQDVFFKVYQNVVLNGEFHYRFRRIRVMVRPQDQPERWFRRNSLGYL